MDNKLQGTLEERETIILINERDRREGFFSIWTNSPVMWSRIGRRLSNEVRDGYITSNSGSETSTPDGFLGVNIKVPISHLSLASLGLKKRKQEGQGKKMSDEVLKRLKGLK